MNAVFSKDELVAEYITRGLGDNFSPPFVCIGFTRDDKTLCGGALFNGWNGSNIEVTIYAPRALTRYAMGVICRYSFVQLKANRLTSRTRRSNKPVQRLLPGLGFVFEGTQKRYFGPHRSDDALLYALFPNAAEKWMR